MRNRILFAITICLTIILIIISSKKNTTYFFSKPNLKVAEKKETNNLIDIEDYVIGVVAGEMPASFNKEALKAQAIATRTYALYQIKHNKQKNGIVTDVSNQNYITISEMKDKWQGDFSKYYQKIKECVNDTKNIVMFFNDKLIKSFYFAMSNGYTENGLLVFNEDKDYLQSVSSEYENKNLKNFEVKKEISIIKTCNLLNIKCNNFIINKIERSNTNRVNYIIINNNKFKGTDIRKKLGLRSTDFDIIKKDDNLIITTRGYGHGVGMSQYGAQLMAENGFNYEQILKHYYKNIKISSI